MSPFVMQLFVVPVLTIGLGILGFYLFKKLYVAPLITLILAVGYDAFYFAFTYHQFGLSSWDIILPILSFLIAYALNADEKNANKAAK